MQRSGDFVRTSRNKAVIKKSSRRRLSSVLNEMRSIGSAGREMHVASEVDTGYRTCGVGVGVLYRRRDWWLLRHVFVAASGIYIVRERLPHGNSERSRLVVSPSTPSNRIASQCLPLHAPQEPHQRPTTSVYQAISVLHDIVDILDRTPQPILILHTASLSIQKTGPQKTAVANRNNLLIPKTKACSNSPVAQHYPFRPREA
ncbi:hypothetical protein K505DRAFT_58822 [Melanomma pulvis-pyrius CBS 109.77]|uniref:Uncharacterized protein n=1 Tax=Melanomma pulvis-pyrius CBS 109.77 TaxID=1314802 RepID=A0A6A6X792_9PLEO|nr:hypothetical protein K505DRAFT_58822 [Melanomma pulvis-pyrius CBS 109.77]